MTNPEVTVSLLVLFTITILVLYWSFVNWKQTSDCFQLPENVEIVTGVNGPLLRGPASALFPAIIVLFWELSHKPVGSRVRMGMFEFRSSNEIPLIPDPLVVVLPPDAWNILASKFAEVVSGREESPFYFAECGYLSPRPEPDIGIELVGPPFED